MSSSMSNEQVETKKFSYLSVYRRSLSYAAGTRVILSVYMTLILLACLLLSWVGGYSPLSPVPFTFFSWHLLSYSLCACLGYVLLLYISRVAVAKEMSMPVKWWYKDIKSFFPGLLWVIIAGSWLVMSVNIFLVAPHLLPTSFSPPLWVYFLVYFLVAFLVHVVTYIAVMHQVYQRESAIKSLCFSIRNINRYIWRSIFVTVFYMLFNWLWAIGSGLFGSIAFVLVKMASHHGHEVLLVGLATVFAVASAACVCVLLFRYCLAFLFVTQSLYIEIFGSLSKRRADEVKHM